MKVPIRFVAGVTIAVCATVALGQPESAAARKQMEQLMAQYDAKASAGDLDGFMALLAKEFTYVDSNGKSTDKAEFREEVKRAIAATREFSVKTTIKNVQSQQRDAVVWTETVFSFKSKVGERWTPMKMTIRFAHTLRRAGALWVFAQTQELFNDEPWSFRTHR